MCEKFLVAIEFIKTHNLTLWLFMLFYQKSRGSITKEPSQSIMFLHFSPYTEAHAKPFPFHNMGILLSHSILGTYVIYALLTANCNVAFMFHLPFSTSFLGYM